MLTVQSGAASSPYTYTCPFPPLLTCTFSLLDTDDQMVTERVQKNVYMGERMTFPFHVYSYPNGYACPAILVNLQPPVSFNDPFSFPHPQSGGLAYTGDPVLPQASLYLELSDGHICKVCIILTYMDPGSVCDHTHIELSFKKWREHLY